MKAPYKLMDNNKEKRQMNRLKHKNLNFISSPSKEKLLLDGQLRLTDYDS